MGHINGGLAALEASLSRHGAFVEGRRMEQTSGSNTVWLDETLFTVDFHMNTFTLRHDGFCPVCQSETSFMTSSTWFRDFYVCTKCGSVPRHRQIYKLLYKQKMNVHTDCVLEFAPDNDYLKKKFEHYTGSQYFPNAQLGTVVHGFRNEDIENITYSDNTFDFVIHADIFEHIFHPMRAIEEIYRVLRVGGKSIFCFPIYENAERTTVRAKKSEQGDIVHLLPPDYHGNPVDPEGSLVVYEYGHDVITMMFNVLSSDKAKWTHVDAKDPDMGINGKFLDCFMLEKIS